MDGEAFAPLLECLLTAASGIIRNDAGRERGRNRAASESIRSPSRSSKS